ncbi:MAG: type II toxin-antitoxin system MqsA family antitoxin [Desulfuromonadaceae bacterium]|nr:type II toxin-antitoxin system MqsA family antitoxin [Desulfuromonadaceae bacterium]
MSIQTSSPARKILALEQREAAEIFDGGVNAFSQYRVRPHIRATGAYGQLPGRDFNPLDLLLLLRTVRHD